MRVMDRIFVCLMILCVASEGFASPFILWTTTGDLPADVSSLKVPSSASPLVVFILPEFNLADFNRYADVYSAKGTGGKLSHLKSVLEQSKDFSLVDSEEPLKQIRDKIESQVPESFVDTYPDTDGSLIYSYVSSISALDAVVPEVVSRLNDKAYTAVIVGQEQRHHIEKRSADDKPKPAPPAPKVEFFSIDGHCAIYLGGTLFSLTDGLGSMTKFAPASEASLSAKGDCPGNYTGELTLSYKDLIQVGKKYGDATMKLESLDVRFVFRQTITKAYWYIGDHDSGLPHAAKQSTVDVINAKVSVGDTTGAAASELTAISTTRALAAKGFSFTCAAPNEYVTTILNKTGNLLHINFEKLQIQPVLSNSTSTIILPYSFFQPDDCIGFFSIGIWMGVLSMFVLLLVFFFGISMVANLKTMDRFDDPRQKPLVINVKE